MSDPLSLAASIAGLASLGDLLFRKLYHFVKCVKGAEKEVVELKQEVASLAGVLHNLVLVTQDLEAESTVSYTVRPEHVNSCLALLHKLDDELKSIGIKDPGKIQKHLKKLTWPFKSIKVREYIEDIRKQRDTLNTALTADSFNALLQSLSIQKDISKSVTDMSEHVTGIETLLRERERVETRIKLDSEREHVLNHFLSVNPQPNFQTSVALRCATTGFWLTEDETFCRWVNGSCACMWMSGIPGAGKTVLSGLVIQGCMARASAKCAVAFFYCDYKNLSSQKPINVLASLASQIAQQSETSFQILQDYYSRLKPRDHLNKEPEVQEMVDILREMSSSFDDVRIIVDGLDECGDNAGSLTENLLALNDTSGNTISLALLSRRERDIEKAIARQDHGHIEIAARSKDVDHYVRSEIEQRMSNGRLPLRTAKIKDEIIHELVARATGMFRWVSCQLDHLCELPTDKERRRALKKLPKTLHESYERILMRLESPEAILLVQNCLRWTAYANPRLSLDQLLDLLSLDEEEQELDDENRPDIDYILKYCGSLTRKSQDLSRLELAHFTVLEFLEAIDCENARLKPFRLSRQDLSLMWHTSAMYLSASNFNQPNTAINSEEGLDEFNKQHPFHRHAAVYPDQFAGPGLDDTAASTHMRKLFHPNLSFNIRIVILQRICYVFVYYGDMIDEIDRINKIMSPTFGPLHAASLLGLDKICQWLLDLGYDVNEESPLGGPLECALFGYGEFEQQTIPRKPSVLQIPRKTVRLLLLSGADCHAKSTREHSLSYAAAMDGVKVDSILFEVLKSGMPIHTDTLQHLHYRRHFLGPELERLVEALDADQRSYQTRLQLLRILNRRYPTAHTQSQPSLTMTDNELLEAVKFSVQFNHCNQLEELIRDSRFSTYTEEIGLLIHLAAENDTVDTLRTLTKFHPDALTHTNSDGETSWHIAAHHGHVNVLKLLLLTGKANCAPLHVKSRKGLTPILSAMEARRTECALLMLNTLIDAGAYVGGFEVLSYATAFGLKEVLDCLTQIDFDFTTSGVTGCTALFCITAKTPSEVVDVLLEQGLHPDRRDHTGKTALNSLLSMDLRHYDDYMKSEENPFWHFIPVSTMKKIVSSSSAAIADDAGHLPWFYLCSRYIPYFFKYHSYTPIAAEASLKELLLILMESSACSAYDESTSKSSISLLIKTFLDLEININTGAPGKFYSSKSASGLMKDMIESLHAVLRSRTALLPPTNDPQLIRLTIWLLQKEDGRDLLSMLLALDVDIYFPSYSSNDRSVFDMSCSPHVPINCLEIILKAADAQELSKPTNSSRWGLEILAVEEIFKESAIEKLDMILKFGVNPDSIVDREEGTSLILEAARRGFLEAIKLLDHHKADVHYSSHRGWTIHAWAVIGENAAIVQFLLDRTPLPKDWTRRYAIIEKTTAPIPAQIHVDCSLVHIAATKPTTDILQALKDSSFFPDLNQITQEGYTPLHIAAKSGSVESVKWLINNHVDISPLTTTCGSTPLHFAMATGSVANVIALVEAKAKFLPNANGKTPELAAHHEKLKFELIELLPHCGVELPLFVLENLGKPTDLFQAILSNNLDACRKALEQGQSVDAPFSCGCTPLYTALDHRRLSIVDLFLNHGASVGPVLCEHVHRVNVCLWDFVIKNHHNSILASLLQNSLKSGDHWIHCPVQPLHVAAALNPEAIDIIIDHMTSNATVYAGYSSLPLGSIQNGCYQKYWLDCVTDYFPHGNRPVWYVEGGTALHIAVKSGRSDSVEKLLHHGANPNARDNRGKTPLHHAACASTTDYSKILIAHGACIRLRDNDLMTPFMEACRCSEPNAVLLMDPNVDVSIRDIWGRSALHHVAFQANAKLFGRFVELGWDPYLQEINGYTPISAAAWKGNQFATYLRASMPQASHIVEMPMLLTYHHGKLITDETYRHLCRSMSPSALKECFRNVTDSQCFSLNWAATYGYIKLMDIFLRAGADLEYPQPYRGTPLIMACTVGQLGAVRYLIRRGANLYSSLNGSYINAVQAARDNPNVVAWLLVGRYTEQLRIASTALESVSAKELRPWSGIRQIEVPLKGRFKKTHGSSLLELATWLRSEFLPNEHWKVLVPLNWDPLPYMVPLPSEIILAESKRLCELYGASYMSDSAS